ncbi:cation:proton antiporter [Shigella flexneri]
MLLFLLPFASYLIAEHIGVSGILAAVAAGMTITRSGVMRRAPLAMRLRANSTWQCLSLCLMDGVPAVGPATAGHYGIVADCSGGGSKR